MKIISFNTNGLRARLHQIEALIKKHNPDIIGIQETKVADESFPKQAIEDLGYQVHFHGQKGHYGVCLMSRLPALEIVKGFPDDEDDAQKRMIIGRYTTPKGNTVTVLNGYFPQGENISHPTKFPAKRRFYHDLQKLLESRYTKDENLLVIGDMNISSTDLDIGIGEPNRKAWLRNGKASFQPEERIWMEELLAWGLTDTFRDQHPSSNDAFSWFDYRSRGFEREPRRGLRIDLILATKTLSERCLDTGIDYEIRAMDKPSDHCPIWSHFSI